MGRANARPMTGSSEAIHSHRRKVDCFVAFAPRKDGAVVPAKAGTHTPRPRSGPRASAIHSSRCRRFSLGTSGRYVSQPRTPVVMGSCFRRNDSGRSLRRAPPWVASLAPAPELAGLEFSVDVLRYDGLISGKVIRRYRGELSLDAFPLAVLMDVSVGVGGHAGGIGSILPDGVFVGRAH